MDKHHFKYSLDDYIVQNMVRDIKQKADVAAAKGFHIEESMWRATAKTFNEEQTAEITAVMKSFYSAFNRKNFDELRALWLPDEGVELTFPGLEKAVSRSMVYLIFPSQQPFVHQFSIFMIVRTIPNVIHSYCKFRPCPFYYDITARSKRSTQNVQTNYKRVTPFRIC